MTGLRVTMRDIAQKLGVSITTIGLALRNHHRISKARRREIQQVAAEMGYQPDPALNQLAVYRWGKTRAKFHGTIAWVRHWQQPDQRSKFRYHAEIWQGVVQEAARHGYQVEAVCWEQGFTARRFEQILTSRGVSAILIPPHHPAPDWADFAWDRFSVVRFGLSVPVPDSNLVTPDGFRAMVMAVNKIHEYGYQRIGLIVGAFDAKIGGAFCGGFLSAQHYLQLAPALPPLESNVDRYRENPRLENKALEQWLKRHRPDAVIINEAHVIAQLKELGCRIPKDIAVAATSVHDIPVDAGIDQDAEAVGSIAVETLVKQINFNQRGEPEHRCRILVEGRWQDGKSLPNRRKG